MIEAKWTSNREYIVSNFKITAIADLCSCQIVSTNIKHGKISGWIIPYPTGFEGNPFECFNPDVVLQRGVNDVPIGQDKIAATDLDHYTGTCLLYPLLILSSTVRSTRVLSAPLFQGFNMDHRGGYEPNRFAKDLRLTLQ
jgi:hypothetical protein